MRIHIVVNLDETHSDMDGAVLKGMSDKEVKQALKDDMIQSGFIVPEIGITLESLEITDRQLLVKYDE